MTTESPRRTQITVVERTRLPSARSSGWARLDGMVEVALTMADDDFAGREKDGFIGNFQYIANHLLIAELGVGINPPKVRY
jgi:hypothetical protein